MWSNHYISDRSACFCTCHAKVCDVLQWTSLTLVSHLSPLFCLPYPLLVHVNRPLGGSTGSLDGTPTFRGAFHDFSCVQPSSYGRLRSTYTWSPASGRASCRAEGSLLWLVIFAKVTWKSSMRRRRGMSASSATCLTLNRFHSEKLQFYTRSLRSVCVVEVRKDNSKNPVTLVYHARVRSCQRVGSISTCRI